MIGDIPIYVKRLSDDAIIPKQLTEGSVGYDLYLNEDVYLFSGATVLCSTGIAIELPVGYEAQIRSRSGLSSDGIVVANGIGTIDSDYRGEVKILLHSRRVQGINLDKGMRVAQMVIAKVPSTNLIEVQELSDTQRGGGGFGSSGKK